MGKEQKLPSAAGGCPWGCLCSWDALRLQEAGWVCLFDVMKEAKVDLPFLTA